MIQLAAAAAAVTLVAVSVGTDARQDWDSAWQHRSGQEMVQNQPCPQLMRVGTADQAPYPAHHRMETDSSGTYYGWRYPYAFPFQSSYVAAPSLETELQR